MPRIIERIDHVVVGASDAEGLFSLLVDTLELPVAWPMSDYGSFASGGVGLGNVNLEVSRSANGNDAAPSSRYIGLAFEPIPLDSALDELRARGIPARPQEPFRAEDADGNSRILWTLVDLPAVSMSGLHVFLCEYSSAIPIEEQRADMLRELRSRDGGPLGVSGVIEVVHGAPNPESSRRDWAALLSPHAEDAPGRWQLGAGPALRVIHSEVGGITELVIGVVSLPRARAFLLEHDLLEPTNDGTVIIAKARLGGITIRLVESGRVSQVPGAP